jgi:hypothetical protein
MAMIRERLSALFVPTDKRRGCETALVSPDFHQPTLVGALSAGEISAA